jgi:dsRNA-specific ribonuclease
MKTPSRKKYALLGDSILYLYLTKRAFSQKDENYKMHYLIHYLQSNKTLGKIYDKLNLDCKVLTDKSKGTVVEALIGQFYLRNGQDKTDELIHHLYHKVGKIDDYY